MCEAKSSIENSILLTDIFGYWPSFHDAEVIEVNVWRGEVDPNAALYNFPVLTIKSHVWEFASESDVRGILIMRHHTLTTLRFHDLLDEDFEINGFNHENAIFGLSITRCERDSGPSPYLDIKLQQSFGISGRFKRMRAEVLTALPCDDKGRPLITQQH